MPQIHYDQIGTLDWCEQYRNQLEVLMEQALNGDAEAAALVVNCAVHFYGLVIWDFADVPELIDAIKAMDQQLEFC